MTNKTENDVVVLRPTLPSAAATEATALIGMIERASRDPGMDLDRMKAMWQMYQDAAARSARAAYDAALSEMQPKLPVVEKRGRGHNKTAYALWEDIAEPIAKVNAQHGFCLTFRVKKTEACVAVTAVLGHRDGHREETTLELPIDTSGNKNAVQAIGSSTSYGKRYTAGLLLNIITKGEDNDGATAGASEKISEQQSQTLRATIENVGANVDGFLRYMKVNDISEIEARDFDRAMVALKKKGRSNG